MQQSDSKAKRYYNKAAEQGLPKAQSSLGFMYIQGQGVRQNYDKARVWFEKAEAQGFPQAQCALGLMHSLGHGVEQSDEKAKALYERAAKQGDSQAQHNLGFVYESAYGVEQSDCTAMRWYGKAAAQGYLKSLERINGILRNDFSSFSMSILDERAPSTRERGDVGGGFGVSSSKRRKSLKAASLSSWMAILTHFD